MDIKANEILVNLLAKKKASNEILIKKSVLKECINTSIIVINLQE